VGSRFQSLSGGVNDRLTIESSLPPGSPLVRDSNRFPKNSTITFQSISEELNDHFPITQQIGQAFAIQM
jgi:hypothetical protein